MYDVLWHPCVDLAGQLDEARVLTILARFPGEIKRIDRNAMPAQSWAGIKRHETKRFCFRRFDYFPDVNAHRGIDHLQFVYQRDIYAAKNVFEQFRRLSCATR